MSCDFELYSIIQKETDRQNETINLIASENYTTSDVHFCNSVVLSNKYAEGYPGKRYYGGCEHIDELETLCQKRALETYNLNPEVWGVNVQSYSGSTANMSIYCALLNPGDTISSLSLDSGGHISHGTGVSNSSKFFTTHHYRTTLDGLIDYNTIKPCDLLIVGGSAYPRALNYKRFWELAQTFGAKVLVDMSHIGGLVAGGITRLGNPFEYSDVVMTTTHKTLRGPRGALIFYKRELENAINKSVFPGTNGGAHYNVIAGIASCLKNAQQPDFRDYSERVVYNARVLSDFLSKNGLKVVTNGTDNHIILVDLSSTGVSGGKFEKLAERCGVSLNKNTVPGDTKPGSPNGIRLGTAAMTTRGFGETEWIHVGELLFKILELAQTIMNGCSTKKLTEFVSKFSDYENEIQFIRSYV